MSHSETKKDFWGKTYTQHYDDNGDKIGRSELKKDFWGKEYVQHYDKTENKNGHSKAKKNFWGKDYMQNFDERGNKSGSSENSSDIWGNTFTQHYDSDGNKSGRSERRKNFWGKEYIHTEGSVKYSGGGKTSGTGSDSGLGSENSAIDSGVTLILWIVGIVAIIYIVIWLVFNVIIPLLFLNSALIFTILTFTNNRKTLFAILAVAGGVYIFFDIKNGWMSAEFARNVVRSYDWVKALVYINFLAVGLSTARLIFPLWVKAIYLESSQHAKSNLLKIICILTVGIAGFSVPVLNQILPTPLLDDSLIRLTEERTLKPTNAVSPKAQIHYSAPGVSDKPEPLDNESENSKSEGQTDEADMVPEGFQTDRLGNWYRGHLNSKGNLEGQGVLIINNDYMYTIHNGNRYEGEFNDGILTNGTAEIKDIYGNVYKGEYSNNRREGKGVLIVANGSRYEGVFTGDILTKGTVDLIDSYGNHYIGEYSNNRKEGKGVLITSQGSRYDGFFENDLLVNGTVDLKEADFYGSTYKGGFSKNRKEGKGLLTMPDGSRYDGIFVDDRFWNGQASIYGSDGKMYVIQYINGVQH